MKKIFLIGWKDVTLAFRDRAALILMLAAPFLLTLGLGFVTGRFSGSTNTGLRDIPVIIVNQDDGSLGDELVKVFQSEELDTLINVYETDDPDRARRSVDEDRAAAAVVIPAGFTRSIIPEGSAPPTETVTIQVYTNPTSPTSSGVVKTIVEEFVNRVEVLRVSGEVTVRALIAGGFIQPQDASRFAKEVVARQNGASGAGITIKNVTGQSEAVRFDPMALLAPGMALMFLMFTVSNGGRTLLAERAQGTLPRLLVSPTSAAQVLGGKVFGIYLTGAAQMLILVLASTLLFQLNWGDAAGVLALVLAAVVGAAGWGLVITALAKSPGQVGAVGSAVMLVFGVLGGSFINLERMPPWFRLVAKITPNSWGLDGFTTLAMGGRLADIREPLLALLLMGIILFGVAALLMNRRGLTEA